MSVIEFAIIAHAHSHGQSKINFLKTVYLIHHWMQNLKLIKLYSNTISEKSVIFELGVIEVFRNQGIKCANKLAISFKNA